MQNQIQKHHETNIYWRKDGYALSKVGLTEISHKNYDKDKIDTDRIPVVVL